MEKGYHKVAKFQKNQRIHCFLQPLFDGVRGAYLELRKEKTLWAGFLLCLCVVTFLSWIHSGTLVPYATTLEEPRILGCGYLGNTDHDHFLGAYHFFAGHSRSDWESSLVLRRVLYPWLGQIPMSLLGFVYGGFLTNLLLIFGSFLIFSYVYLKRFGAQTVIASLVIFTLNPGMYYWVGLPYYYAIIVPSLLLGFVLLTGLEAAQKEKHYWLIAAAFGILYTGYDPLLVFFVLPTLMLARNGLSLFCPRLWGRWMMLLLLQLLPMICVAVYQEKIHGIAAFNTNSHFYYRVLKGYLAFEWKNWLPVLEKSPEVFIKSIFGGNYVFLPAAAVILFLSTKWKFLLKNCLGRSERFFLFNFFLFWAFAELAPPYIDDSRGSKFARVYQPLSIVIGVLYARFWAEVISKTHPQEKFSQKALIKNRLAWSRLKGHHLALFAGFLALTLNLAVLLGNLSGWSLTSKMHYWFHRHGTSRNLMINHDLHGVRPLGICKENGEIVFPSRKI